MKYPWQKQAPTGAPDAERFAAQIGPIADKAYNYAYRLTGNDSDARDMVQEAFARAFAKRDAYDAKRPFEAWVLRILRNVFLDSVRRYEHRHKVSIDAPMGVDGDGDWEDILPGSDPEPMRSLERREEASLLQSALLDVPFIYRNAVTLYDVEGLSYEEIARMTGSPIGTVCSRIHQGRLLLRKAYERRERLGAGKGAQS